MKEKNDEYLNNMEQQDEKNQYEKVKDFQGAGHNINPIKATAQTMADRQYITERVEDQIKYFGAKASKAQKKYKKYKRWEIIIAACIPVLIAFSTLTVFSSTVFWWDTVEIEGVLTQKSIFSLSTILQIIAAIGGIAIVVLKGLVDLEDYYKTWKDFRSTEMTMLQEKYKFVTRTEPYDETDAYALLVEEIEGILNKENQKWRSVKKQENKFTKKTEEAMLSEFDKKRKETNYLKPIAKPAKKTVPEKIIKKDNDDNVEVG